MGLSAHSESEVPETKSRSDHPIDAFIDYKLETTGIPAAPLADRRTLIRRANFDLIGLPPTPQEVDAFVKDKRSDLDAFKDVIDRLLLTNATASNGPALVGCRSLRRLVRLFQ